MLGYTRISELIIILLLLLLKSVFLTLSLQEQQRLLYFSFNNDFLRISLQFLTLLITLFLFLAVSFQKKQETFHSLVLLIILLILVGAFSVQSLLSFYFLFEVSLIPICLLILG